MKSHVFALETRVPASYRALRYLTVAVVSIWFPLALWSGYRAVVQIFSLELHAPPALAAGSVVRADVRTSGRAHTDVSIELVQGSRRVLVSSTFVAGNRDGALDPRPRRASVAAVLEPRHLDGWASGPILVRATAVGRKQWMRLPPPTVREVVVRR